MQLYDHVALDKADVRMTNDGYLVCMPRVARTGIQIYGGNEVGMPSMDTVRVYRPPEEVFNKDSMVTFAYRPITDDHPSKPVSASNWKDYAVGQSGGEVARDGEFMRVPMVVMDEKVIKKYKDGKVELSVGYATDLKWEPGKTPDGQQYDAIQTSIRANHIAIVDAARGGHKLRIGDQTERSDTSDHNADSAAGENDMSDQAKAQVSVMVDSIALQMDATAAAVVTKSLSDAKDKLNSTTAQLTTVTADAAKAKTEFEATVAKLTADHKVALDALTAQNDALKKQVTDSAITPAKLDQMVKDRSEVFSKAKAILGDKLVIADKSMHDVRKQVVDAKLGDTAKAYTEDQVKIAFDSLTNDIKVDPASTAAHDTARAFSGSFTPAQVGDKAKMYAEADKKLENRWKGPQAA
jgi:hypothetical protein